MEFPKRVATGGLAVLLIVALSFLAQPARAATNKPSWAAGDFWVYSYQADSFGSSFTGSLRLDVVGTDSVTLNGTPYPSYHVKAAVSYDFGGGSFTYRGDVWYTTDSLAIAKIAIAVNLTGNIEITIWGNPPQSIHWPLTTGDSWTSSTDVTIKELFTSNGSSMSTYTKLQTTFTVLADTSITVPVGTFTTTPVKETEFGSTSYNVNYWSPQAGNSVRTEGYNGSGGPAGGYNLTSYNYQAGNFFTTVFVGLPVWIWLILAVLIVAALIGVSRVRRRRPPVGASPPGYTPPEQPPESPP